MGIFMGYVSFREGTFFILSKKNSTIWNKGPIERLHQALAAERGSLADDEWTNSIDDRHMDQTLVNLPWRVVQGGPYTSFNIPENCRCRL